MHQHALQSSERQKQKKPVRLNRGKLVVNFLTCPLQGDRRWAVGGACGERSAQQAGKG